MGGTGFIRSYVADWLLMRGHRVRSFDDLSTGRRDNVLPAVEVLEGSIAEAAVVAKPLQDADVILHLAAIASVEDPLAISPNIHMVRVESSPF